MGNKTEQFRSSEGNRGNTHLLRLGVIFLSIVSFFTTASGMRDYIFQDNAFIAYAASAAIQGILLAMSMNLPSYLAKFWRGEPADGEEEKPDSASESGGFYRIWNPIKASIKGIGMFFGRLILSAFVVVLTFVTLLCSSWFSYVYIADVLHEDSWDVDSELLVQQVYRTQLYKGREYANTYRIYLEESLGAEILTLETQAEEVPDNTIGAGIDWDEEEQTYAQGIARIYMTAPINAMRAALAANPSPEDKNLAVIAVSDAQKNIGGQMNNIQQDIKTQNDNIRTYTDLINRLNSQIANAADDRDTSVLEESLRRYENLILNATQRLPELQDEYSQLYNAQQRLPVYESQLGLNSSTSSTSIRSELMKLQAEFFQQDPDEAIMLNHATEIFKSLRDAASSTSSEPAEDGSTYSELLVQMNRLIQNLRDYSEIKDIEANLDTMISGLRTLEAASGMRTETDPNQPVVLENESAATDGSTPGESEETGGNVSTDGTLPNEDNAVGGGSLDGTAGNEHESASADNDVSGEDAATGGEIPGDSALPTGEDNSTGGDSSDGTGNNVDWKSEWGSRLAELKVQISSLPSYSGVQNGTHTVLLESQVEILRKYDRDSSSRELDDVIRRYISVHNAVYQGIIYLQSPYRSLAVFALILALSFDLSGFVFGLVTLSSAPLVAESYEAEPFPETPNPEIPASDGSDLATPPDGEDDTVTWSILPALNPYVVLTGDYEIQDGVYYYKCFRNGQLYRWKVIDSAPYQRGIYTENTESGRVCGKPLAADQALLFSGQPGGPRDGIYRNCQLVYMDGSLLKGGEGEFLASVEEFVPVHIYIPSEGKNRTIPVKMLAVPSGENVDNNSVFVREAVISLTPNGTRVAAIYAIEGNITVRDTALGQKQV